uniref:Uncharacterized protein n=1 Tax=Mola mola TaxID=94237 RepID=A0A3Q4BBB4_MOLML
MLKKKSSSGDKKRKHSKCEERRESSKRRSTESRPELDRIGSDIEDGGLDLSLPFQPITAYVGDKREMLEQCFHVLGEKKLRKMLPDELKDGSLEDIKKLCWEQLEPIAEKNLTQILAGETEGHIIHDPVLPAGGSGEESDVLSINADAYDSDIEGPKEEKTAKASDDAAKVTDHSGSNPEPPIGSQATESKKDIQSDIDKSVSEILPADDGPSVLGGAVESGAPEVCQPSIQQLELLELEMRARAIKALMKASDGKKPCLPKDV